MENAHPSVVLECIMDLPINTLFFQQDSHSFPNEEEGEI